MKESNHPDMHSSYITRRPASLAPGDTFMDFTDGGIYSVKNISRGKQGQYLIDTYEDGIIRFDPGDIVVVLENK